jgi:putative membrane protein
MKLISKWLLNALIIFGLSYLPVGVHIDSYFTALLFALVLSILNYTIKPILILFTLPISIFTLGLFLFAINAIVIWMAAGLVSGISIDSFSSALIFSLLLSVASYFFYSD